MLFLDSQQRRFLLRASALVIVFLSTWWFLLQRPVLMALRGALAIPFAFMGDAAITVEPTGEWTFRAPVQDLPDEALRRMGTARINSLDFTVPPRDLLVFTLGLPFYLAVSLAIPGPRRLRPLFLGCGLQVVVAVACAVLFVEVTAYNSLGQMRAGASSAFERWYLALAWYLVTSVIPYVMPVITAIWLHSELRHRIFTASAMDDNDTAAVPGDMPVSPPVHTTPSAHRGRRRTTSLPK